MAVIHTIIFPTNVVIYDSGYELDFFFCSQSYLSSLHDEEGKEENPCAVYHAVLSVLFFSITTVKFPYLLSPCGIISQIFGWHYMWRIRTN